MKKLTFIILLIFIKSIANAQQLEIASPNPPNKVGERVLTFNCPLDGLAKKDIEVWVYYSTSKSELANENCARGRASCSKNTVDPTKILCKFYFPHRDHMKPNKIHDDEKNGQEPLSEENMRDVVQAATAYENMPEIMRNREKQLNTFLYQNYKSINNTDVNERSINNPSKVYYKIVRKKQSTKVESQIFEFTMPRVFVIGYMGDSYAAGEGAPYSGNDKWDDNLCHRSNKSGGMRGINKLIERRRDLVVRVINTTCSGAKIKDVISSPQHMGLKATAVGMSLNNGQNSTQFSQIELIQNWLKSNNRESVDIMLMGIGGNNMGFAPLATAAIAPPNAGIVTKESWFDYDDNANETRKLLDLLPSKYDDLNVAIENQDFKTAKILIMQYPNMLHGKNGELCNGSNSVGCGLDLTNNLFTHIDFFKKVLNQLNTHIDNAANRNGWSVIKVSEVNRHGLCNCEEPYFNNLTESDENQDDNNGAVHPNADGYQELYRDKVYAALKTAVSEVQSEEYKERVKEAIKDAKAAAKEKMDKQVAKTIARKKLQEKYKADLATKAETYLDTLKFEMPKSTNPVKVNLKHNDDPRPKINNEKD